MARDSGKGSDKMMNATAKRERQNAAAECTAAAGRAVERTVVICGGKDD